MGKEFSAFIANIDTLDETLDGINERGEELVSTTYITETQQVLLFVKKAEDGYYKTSYEED